MATKIINILPYTNNWDNKKYLQRGTLSFETIDEAFDYFEEIRQKTKSFEESVGKMNDIIDEIQNPEDDEDDEDDDE